MWCLGQFCWAVSQISVCQKVPTGLLQQRMPDVYMGFTSHNSPVKITGQLALSAFSRWGNHCSERWSDLPLLQGQLMAELFPLRQGISFTGVEKWGEHLGLCQEVWLLVLAFPPASWVIAGQHSLGVSFDFFPSFWGISHGLKGPFECEHLLDLGV